MRRLPLRLTLQPLLATRTPSHGDCFEHGFHLRLPGGPAIERGDPLLAAFGAFLAWVEPEEENEEAMQSDAFEPGRVVTLVPEPFDPYDPNATAVRDAEGTLQAGALDQRGSAVAAAAREAGLEPRGLVLRERRDVTDDRRERIALFVHSPGLIRVTMPKRARVERPRRPVRPRLVLVADGRGAVRWWDPSATRGPLEVSEVPLSADLRDELERLREGFEAVAARSEGHRGFDHEMVRAELDRRAAEVWCRARTELAAHFAVGFLGSGMRSPAWTPRELYGPDGDEDDDIPF